MFEGGIRWGPVQSRGSGGVFRRTGPAAFAVVTQLQNYNK